MIMIVSCNSDITHNPNHKSPKQKIKQKQNRNKKKNKMQLSLSFMIMIQKHFPFIKILLDSDITGIILSRLK